MPSADAPPSHEADTMSDPPSTSPRLARVKQLHDRIQAEIRKVYVGQQELVLGTLVALFSGGHVLIESVPGLGKTLFVRTLGRVLGCQFGRIQFTADLMPSDITGSPIFDLKTQEFRFRPGPVFTQLLLADEINRSPAKTHAALLEIMQEYRVTVDNHSHRLDRPFWCWPPRTRSNRRAPTICPKLSLTGSCSRSQPTTRRSTRKPTF